MDKHKVLPAIFIAFCKALNTVELEVLLENLSYIILEVTNYSGLALILINHTQVVESSRRRSSLFEFIIGVPHGSPNAKLLILNYINFFPRILLKS